MKRLVCFALLAILLIALGACSSPTTAPVQPTAVPPASSSSSASSAPAPTSAPASSSASSSSAAASGGTAGESEAAARAAGLTTLADAYAGKYKGQTVTMTGPFVDADAVKFNDSMKDFQSKTGITIQYAGSKTFEASITAQVQSGAPPDVVDFPQPGLAATFAKQGKVIAADKLIPSAWLKQNYKQSWLDIPTVPGPDGKPMLVGIVQRYNAKDQVFYPKPPSTKRATRFRKPGMT